MDDDVYKTREPKGSSLVLWFASGQLGMLGLSFLLMGVVSGLGQD